MNFLLIGKMADFARGIVFKDGKYYIDCMLSDIHFQIPKGTSAHQVQVIFDMNTLRLFSNGQLDYLKKGKERNKERRKKNIKFSECMSYSQASPFSIDTW